MRKIFSIATILFLLMSCEGYKWLEIQNVSNSDAKITVKPKSIIEYSNQPSDSAIFILQPQSSKVLFNTFGGITIFNKKIKKSELTVDYLKIETKNETVIAKSKKEILKLMYSNNQQGNIKSEGTNTVKITINNGE